MANKRLKQISYLQNGDDKDINVYVDIITKEITFDENIKELSFDILQDILKEAKKAINKGGYNYIE